MEGQLGEFSKNIRSWDVGHWALLAIVITIALASIIAIKEAK
jgi:hypothetical protein